MFLDEVNSCKTPTKLASAIKSTGGVANTVDDLAFINRSHNILKQWVNSRRICKLPRLNEIQYANENQSNNGLLRFTAKIYTVFRIYASHHCLKLYESVLEEIRMHMMCIPRPVI